MGQPDYALAGIPASQSIIGNALMQKAGTTNYNNQSSNNNSDFHITVNAPINASGMTPGQAKSAIEQGVSSALRDAINSSRANIPSPEYRRY
jgi:hypothetical protein